MEKFLAVLALGVAVFANDIIIKSSDYSVDKTIENIKNIVKAKGLSVFTVIDHKANAAGVNMALSESKVIIFGNPQVGTLLMQEDMRIALDLPLRILVYKDHEGQVKVAYRDGTWIKKHHYLKEENLIKKVNQGMKKISDKARLKVES